MWLDGAVRKAPGSLIPLEHGLPGVLVVEVERLSPAEMVLRAAGRSAQPTAAGTVAVWVDGSATTIEYLPWRFLRWGVAASAAVLAGLVVAGLVEHRRALLGWWSGWRWAVRRR